MVLQPLFQNGSSVGMYPVVVALVVLPLVYTLVGSKSSRRAKLPSPPSTLPVLGNTLDAAKNQARFHDWIYSLCQHFNGKPFLLRMLGRPDTIVLTSPDQWEDVLKTHFESFPKGPYLREMLDDLFGEGIFGTDGAKWAHQRKSASNLFTARSLRESMSNTIRKHTKVLFRVLNKTCTSDATVDLFKLLNQFTMEAFAEIGFGIKMNGLETGKEHHFQQSFDRAFAGLMVRIMRPAWFWRLQRWFNVGAEREFKEAIKVIDKTMLDIIIKSFEERQKQTFSHGGTTDLVSLFLDRMEKSPDAQDTEFDPRDLRDLLSNFLLAGRDTTAQSMRWFLLNVSRHPEVIKRIRSEIQHVIPELINGTMEIPTAEQVQQLTYLEAALKESLRLYPIVAFFSRHAQQDIVLSDGTFIPKGCDVGLPSYSMGRMEHVWGPDATEFKPERWIDPETKKLLAVSAFKFTSFNGGPRICLGMNLAMLEMKIVVASLLSRMEIDILNKDEITYDFSITLPLRGGVHAKVRPFSF